jgi:hypothetical protein
VGEPTRQRGEEGGKTSARGWLEGKNIRRGKKKGLLEKITKKGAGRKNWKTGTAKKKGANVTMTGGFETWKN